MIEVIKQNQHFVVVDKPHGTLSIPGRDAKDARPVLVSLLADQLGKKPFVVHRLDAEVGGLMLFALSAESHKAACGWFERHEIQKTYTAFTEITGASDLSCLKVGEWQKWFSKLLRGKKRAYEAPHGKDAETVARFEGKIGKDGREFAKWSLQPLTGRNHQLRFELVKRGFPIVGDALYGAVAKTPGRIELRATKLDFSKVPQYDAWDFPEIIESNGTLEQF